MDLFTAFSPSTVAQPVAAGAVWLPGYACPVADRLYACLQAHFAQWPPQQMTTPMGRPMSVRTSSMGAWGWISHAQGYGYSATNPHPGPHTGQPWPAMPPLLLLLARQAAQQAGYADFVPDSCLINVYPVGSKMGLHQDKDELDFSQPIVSVSLGIPATFLFGGARRSDPVCKIPLHHGDIVVWGGPSRRFYHGVATIRPDRHPLLGQQRINLTLRKAR